MCGRGVVEVEVDGGKKKIWVGQNKRVGGPSLIFPSLRMRLQDEQQRTGQVR